MPGKKHQTYEGLGKKSGDKKQFKKGLSKKRKELKDFQKVKLKAGKLRPKGVNETKLEFQSKLILIREQLRQEAGGERIQVTISSDYSDRRCCLFFPIGYPSPSTQRNFSTETGRARYVEDTCAERWDRCLVASSSVSSRYVYSASFVGKCQSLSIRLAMLEDDLYSYWITRHVSSVHAVALPTTDLLDDPSQQRCSWTICTRARTNSTSAVFFVTVEQLFLAHLGESSATTDENQSIRETIH